MVRFNGSSFELSDLNRQTTWITIYDGRGVLAKSVELHIKVKDNNVMWIDEHVDCSFSLLNLQIDYPSTFHSNTKLPESIGVSVIWHSENTFNAMRSYPIVLLLTSLSTLFLVLGMVVVYVRDAKNEEMSRQFKQPKTQKMD